MGKGRKAAGHACPSLPPTAELRGQRPRRAGLEAALSFGSAGRCGDAPAARGERGLRIHQEWLFLLPCLEAELCQRAWGWESSPGSCWCSGQGVGMARWGHAQSLEHVRAAGVWDRGGLAVGQGTGESFPCKPCGPRTRR